MREFVRPTIHLLLVVSFHKQIFFYRRLTTSFLDLKKYMCFVLRWLTHNNGLNLVNYIETLNNPKGIKQKGGNNTFGPSDVSNTYDKPRIKVHIIVQTYVLSLHLFFFSLFSCIKKLSRLQEGFITLFRIFLYSHGQEKINNKV